LINKEQEENDEDENDEELDESKDQNVSKKKDVVDIVIAVYEKTGHLKQKKN